MAEVLVIGAGVSGLSTAMLLAGDGHEVTVLERDTAEPPREPEAAWQQWERRGVNQFRMLHYFQPQWRRLVEAELPEIAKALDAAGALRFNPVPLIPTELTGGPRDGDDAFEALTGRRPVVESTLAHVAQGAAGITLRRGVAVAGLLTGTEARPGLPHVTGVRTETGEQLTADLVVDATGRRSPLPRWLEAVGARPPHEQREDSGFVYYGRYFRSADGSIPPMMAPLLSHYGSVSVLTLPADNGTWGVGFTTCARDAEMRGLREVERWERTFRQFPMVAHWADGEPLDDGVAVMAKIEDRIRSYSVDGAPVATGVAAVADSWSCTNPSLGRGATIGLMHVLELRNLLRGKSLGDPFGFATRWGEVTTEVMEPWYRATLAYDRHRLAEAEAASRDEPYDPGDPLWDLTRALQHGASQDGDLLRGFLRIAGLLDSVEDVFATPGLADKVIALVDESGDAPFLGPTRSELVELVNA